MNPLMYKTTNIKRRRLHLYRIMAIILFSYLFLSTIGFGINGNSVNVTVLSIVFGHDTIYTQGYTESAWLNIRRGMRGPEVKALIGPPLNTLDYAGGL
jgi:hypothetical protein